MQWMQKIQSVLDEVNNKTGINAGAIAPAAFGGIVGALLTGKSGQKMVGNALLVGGGAALASVLWNKYSARTAQPQNGTAQQIPAFPDPRMARLITAMVFAAKSDGIIDKKEEVAIRTHVEQLQLGPAADEIINTALAQPLDPKVVAANVTSQDEAAEIFLLSCSVIEIDHFMENSYLDALAAQLGIPADVAAANKKNTETMSPPAVAPSGWGF